MLHQVILPTPRFSPAVKNFVVGTGMQVSNHLPANLSTQLVIYLRGASTLLADGTMPTRLPSAFLAGPSLKPLHFEAEPGSAFVVATIRSDYLDDFFDIPSSEIAHQIIPLEDLLPPHMVHAIQEQLAHTHIAQHIVTCVETLLDQARAHKRHALLLLPHFSARELQQSSRILASCADLGLRQFERRFRLRFGVSPRDYRRLARFQQALAAMLVQPPAKGVSTRVAQDSGYYDDAHFTRDFQNFVGAAPGKFIKARSHEDSGYRLWRLEAKDLPSFLD